MEEMPNENQAADQIQDGGTFQESQKELLEMTNRYRYLTAEFDNYKKRTAREQASWTEFAQDQALLDLVGIIDDLERALSGLQQQNIPQEVQSHFEGFALIERASKKLMTKYGIEEIPYKKEFDPALFEAVMQQESPDHSTGEVIAIFQKGYQRNGRVIRPAKVSVAP